MNINTKAFAVAATIGLGSVTGANAGLIDYTVNFGGANLGQSISGSVMVGSDLVGWTLEAVPDTEILISGIENQPAPVGSPLAHTRNGIGVSGGATQREVDYPDQMLVLTFSKAVKLTASYFLDLYTGVGGTESAIITNGVGDSVEIFGTENNPVPAVSAGFQASGALELIGKVFTFSVGPGNDVCVTGTCQDAPNYTLAGVEVAAVPLPAGVLLLGTALAGLGFARRRKA